jgi:hypothetical protein
MTAATSRTVANAVVIAAGATATYFVLRDPRGRRIARRLLRLWLGASVPMYLLRETGRAWVQSAPRA